MSGQHEQKRQQAELLYALDEEFWRDLELMQYGPAEGEEVSTCPACGEEPMTCDCDTEAQWGDREE